MPSFAQQPIPANLDAQAGVLDSGQSGAAAIDPAHLSTLRPPSVHSRSEHFNLFDNRALPAQSGAILIPSRRDGGLYLAIKSEIPSGRWWALGSDRSPATIIICLFPPTTREGNWPQDGAAIRRAEEHYSNQIASVWIDLGNPQLFTNPSFFQGKISINPIHPLAKFVLSLKAEDGLQEKPYLLSVRNVANLSGRDLRNNRKPNYR